MGTRPPKKKRDISNGHMVVTTILGPSPEWGLADEKNIAALLVLIITVIWL